MLNFVNDIQVLTFERFVVTFALSPVERTSPLGTTDGLESRSANLVKLMRNCGSQQFVLPLLLWRLSGFAMFCNQESERSDPSHRSMIQNTEDLFIGGFLSGLTGRK